jgi:6-carboxyhexanoate--CoA ligase
MRASKYVDGMQPTIRGQKEVHISGAEGLYPPSQIPIVIRQYIERALNHPKGKAEKVVVTAELIKQRPQIIPALPVSTVDSQTPDEGTMIVQKILLSLGITKKALHASFAIIKKGGMRGAAIISTVKGTRLESDRQRGVRVSRLGITVLASKRLSERLSHYGINTGTVKEALLLASKVIAHRDVIAEFCVSDDPDYTTGYVASEKFGYVRIPHIKQRGGTIGGRAFFVSEGADITDLINYLETSPVLIGKAALCKGTLSLYEILNNPHC